MNVRLGQDFAAVIETPLVGGVRLGIRCTAAAISAIDYLPPATPLREPVGAVSVQAVSQLRGYFAHPHQDLALPLATGGTAFQQRVWQALCAIPPGQPISYGALARQLGSSARAVAGACRANPVPLLIPCHRVVAANGLGGYMGETAGEAMRLKRWLLEHEAAA